MEGLPAVALWAPHLVQYGSAVAISHGPLRGQCVAMAPRDNAGPFDVVKPACASMEHWLFIIGWLTSEGDGPRWLPYRRGGRRANRVTAG